MVQDRKSVHALVLAIVNGRAQRSKVVTSGTLPLWSEIYRMQFAEKTSRLMSPFSKDETGHES